MAINIDQTSGKACEVLRSEEGRVNRKELATWVGARFRVHVISDGRSHHKKKKDEELEALRVCSLFCFFFFFFFFLLFFFCIYMSTLKYIFN